MSVTFTVGGRAFELAPMSLGLVRKAAPFIDKINATAGAMGEGATLGLGTEVARDMIEVIALCVAKIDPSVTADTIEDELTFDDFPKIQETMMKVLEEAGLARSGEAPAASQPATEAVALESKSSESSTS